MKIAITVLVTCVAALLALGTVMLYSSPVGAPLLSRQLFWCVIGFVVCVMMILVDYAHLKKIAWPLLGVTFLLLALVLIPHVGTWRGGARRWFNLGFMLFQPSELAKLAVIIALAHYGDVYRKKMPEFVRGLGRPALFILPLLILIFLEPDYGTTLLLAAVAAVMLLVAGARWKLVTVLAVIGVAAIAFSIRHNTVRMERIMAYLHPEDYKNTTGYQSWQAMLALGSGGVTGVGLGDGRQKLGYVPENHTDFMLSNIGEELGLVATLGVVFTFVTLMICGIYIAWHARDHFGYLLATGLTFLIGLQAFINIGVVTSALPNKGLPLPFLSYGGSSLVMMLAAVGLLLNVARHAPSSVRVGGRRFNPFHPSDVPSTQLS